MRERIEHASMLLEWIRCHDPDFERFLKTYLFTEGSILQEEKSQLPKESAVAGPRGAEAVARPAYRDGFSNCSLPDQHCASFETAASQLPQDDDFT
jgi:hypothetical protein